MTIGLTGVTIGFTGTQRGLTNAQHQSLWWLLHNDLKPDVFHYGDCIGADFVGARLASELGARIVCHPPLDEAKRGLFGPNDEVRKAKPYLARNLDIAIEARDGLVACPATMTEMTRSGTWATVRYARSLKRTIYFVLPDGSQRTEGPASSEPLKL